MLKYGLVWILKVSFRIYNYLLSPCFYTKHLSKNPFYGQNSVKLKEIWLKGRFTRNPASSCFKIHVKMMCDWQHRQHQQRCMMSRCWELMTESESDMDLMVISWLHLRRSKIMYWLKLAEIGWKSTRDKLMGCIR